MKSFAILFILVASTLASSIHDFNARSLPQHRRLAKKQPESQLVARSAHSRRSLSKRCSRGKGQTTGVVAADRHAVPSSSSSSQPQPTPTPVPAANNTVSQATAAVAGVINVAAGSCGSSGATNSVSADTGPNGSLDWMMCGLNGGGWNPPYLGVGDIVTVPLQTAIQDPNSAFKPCSDYIWLFEKHASRVGVPSILLASFAMQESGCNPSTVGGAGEQGLMQLTKDKCGNAPNGDCKEPDYNIGTGADFFSTTLNNNGGNLLKAIGSYNGYFSGMTYGEATAAAYTTCCRCQQNLDYLFQFLNGWCQNINAYSATPRLGKYFNLDVCHI